jgi:hypothetical protein
MLGVQYIKLGASRRILREDFTWTLTGDISVEVLHRASYLGYYYASPISRNTFSFFNKREVTFLLCCFELNSVEVIELLEFISEFYLRYLGWNGDCASERHADGASCRDRSAEMAEFKRFRRTDIVIL